jgi:two-component system phosphate regulon response regulator PhoB
MASPRHLLLVDDEPHIGLVLRPVLEAQGYEVSLARTLAQARAALTDPTSGITGLLLDLHLPDGSGLDFLLELRARPATARLPVMVLTAEGEDRILSDIGRAGATIVTKPFSPSKLVTQVNALFGADAAA